jgi:REP element-mobilizing transposase RayT
MPYTSSNLLVHLIFSTKRRGRLIKPDLKGGLFAYMGGIIREMHGVALIVNGTEDHIHILIRVPPVLGIAEVTRVLKANSSRWVHEKWVDHREFAWQTGYGAFSVSESNVPAVMKYIAEQEEHHQRRTFQEEYLEFLRKNHMVIDEKYLWD